MTPFQSLRDYEEFAYTLRERSPAIIKHSRVPAPEMSFTQPNLIALIREAEALVARRENK